MQQKKKKKLDYDKISTKPIAMDIHLDYAETDEKCKSMKQ